MYGTALATLIGYFALWLIRSIDTQRYIRYNQNYKTIFLQTALLFIQSFILIAEIPHDIFLAIGVAVLIVLTGRRTIIVIMRRIYSSIGKRLGKNR